MKILISTIILAINVCHMHASLKCNCDKVKCIEPKGCTAGVVFDMCHCCKICAKGEGELCAGSNQVEGQCGIGLQCMVRDLRNMRNRRTRRIEELVGRCEHVMCQTKRCPFGQICSMLNDSATCICPLCKDMMDESVCGETNNKQYKNECELRRDECVQGKKIRLIKGPCKVSNRTQITCSEENMTITIAKAYFGDKLQEKYSLLDGNCVLQENATHLYYTTKLNECGTKPTYTLTTVVHSNVIRTYTNPDSLIIRHKTMQLPIECEYSLRLRNRIRISSKGEFGDRLEDLLRNDGISVKIREIKQQQQQTVTRSHRSIKNLKVDVNNVEKYFIELKANSFAPKKNAIVYPKYCFATPVSQSERWMRYSFLENGCPTESGVEILESKSPVIRMSIPSIKFRGAKYPGVLVKCKVGTCYLKHPLDTSTCNRKCNSLTTDFGSGPTNNDVNNRKKRSSETKYKSIDMLELYGKPILLQ